MKKIDVIVILGIVLIGINAKRKLDVIRIGSADNDLFTAGENTGRACGRVCGDNLRGWKNSKDQK